MPDIPQFIYHFYSDKLDQRNLKLNELQNVNVDIVRLVGFQCGKSLSCLSQSIDSCERGNGILIRYLSCPGSHLLDEGRKGKSMCVWDRVGMRREGGWFRKESLLILEYY